MAVNYVAVKSPLKTKETSKFIKVVKSECIDNNKIARRISDQCSVTEADVLAVLQAYETNLKIEFANGNSVQMFNLGTMKPCFKAEFDDEGNVVKSSLRLSKIRLITTNNFINEAQGYQYKYCGEIDYNKTDLSERVENLKEYLSAGKPYITSAEYASLNRCSIVTAGKDLNLLTENGLIYADKIGSTYIYLLNTNSQIDTFKRVSIKEKSADDEYVKMFYELIGGNYSLKPLTSENFSESENENAVVTKACETVMSCIAKNIGVNDIYDEKVISKLDAKVFPVKMMMRKRNSVR